jgi:hypothetical protein
MAIARLVAAGVSVLLMAWLSIEAYRLGVADEIVTQSNETMEGAAWRKSPPSLQAWLAVRNDLMQAERLAPESPAVHESLGVLHARRAASPEMLAYARDYFIAALEGRPTSPYTWANYAETKYLLGETGGGFERALVRAAEMGPWEPEVQRVVADVGLATFNEVQARTRATIERMVAFGMRRQPLEILQIAQRRGRLDVACRHVADNKHVTDLKWITLCEKGRTT